MKTTNLATAGAIVKNTYFYAFGAFHPDSQKHIFTVHDINTDTPTVSNATGVMISTAKFKMFYGGGGSDGVFDFTGIYEADDKDDLIVDGVQRPCGNQSLLRDAAGYYATDDPRGGEHGHSRRRGRGVAT